MERKIIPSSLCLCFFAWIGSIKLVLGKIEDVKIVGFQTRDSEQGLMKREKVEEDLRFKICGWWCFRAYSRLFSSGEVDKEENDSLEDERVILAFHNELIAMITVFTSMSDETCRSSTAVWNSDCTFPMRAGISSKLDHGVSINFQKSLSRRGEEGLTVYGERTKHATAQTPL